MSWFPADLYSAALPEIKLITHSPSLPPSITLLARTLPQIPQVNKDTLNREDTRNQETDKSLMCGVCITWIC